MGIIILKRRYDFSKYLSVLMITAGIVICTIVSGSNVVSIHRQLTHLIQCNNVFAGFFFVFSIQIVQKSTANPDLAKEEASAYSVFFWWLCGIALLTFALFVSARMGIYQEVLYKQHGKHPREALYITVSDVIHSNLLHTRFWSDFH